jgi:hypothetical protein
VNATGDTSAPHDDPVLERRARLARLASLGQRSGYLAFVVSIAVFTFGMSTGFTDGVATSLVVLLVVGSFVLAPSIVLHHAVRATDAEDRGGSGH